MKYKAERSISIIICMVLLSACFFSCRMRSAATHFTEQLILSDSLISNGETDQAIKLLKKLIKKASNEYDFLGLYRRFSILGNKNLASKSLLVGLEKLPTNPELTAVYTYELIKDGVFDKALTVGKSLLDTRYASLYSEAIVLNTKNQLAPFIDASLSPVYNASAIVTGNIKWKKNAVVCLSAIGDYEAAYKYHPTSVTKYDDPYFWACVAYDAGKLVQCISDLEKAENTAEVQLLKADAYILADEANLAARCWQTAIQNWPDFSPVMYVNAARSAALSLNDKIRESALTGVVNTFPDFIPGLVDYGKFALETTRVINDDAITASLRASGRKTIEMKLEDNRPKVPISDALYRMEQSLSRNNNASLLVEYTKLKWAQPMADGLGDPVDGNRRVIDMWEILEKNMTEADVYPPYLVRYAVWLFLSQRREEEALRLFESHIARRYGIAANEGVDTVSVITKLESWECEYSAFFAVTQGRYKEASVFYEYLITGRREAFPELAGGSEYKTPVSVYLNLGTLYYGANKVKSALELYGMASGKTVDKKARSEIQYRIACIQYDRGEYKAASEALEYAVLLNPDHSKARLMLKKIKV